MTASSTASLEARSLPDTDITNYRFSYESHTGLPPLLPEEPYSTSAAGIDQLQLLQQSHKQAISVFSGGQPHTGADIDVNKDQSMDTEHEDSGHPVQNNSPDTMPDCHASNTVARLSIKTDMPAAGQTTVTIRTDLDKHESTDDALLLTPMSDTSNASAASPHTLAMSSGELSSENAVIETDAVSTDMDITPLARSLEPLSSQGSSSSEITLADEFAAYAHDMPISDEGFATAEDNLVPLPAMLEYQDTVPLNGLQGFDLSPGGPEASEIAAAADEDDDAAQPTTKLVPFPADYDDVPVVQVSRAKEGLVMVAGACMRPHVAKVGCDFWVCGGGERRGVGVGTEQCEPQLQASKFLLCQHCWQQHVHYT